MKGRSVGTVHINLGIEQVTAVELKKLTRQVQHLAACLDELRDAVDELAKWRREFMEPSLPWVPRGRDVVP